MGSNKGIVVIQVCRGLSDCVLDTARGVVVSWNDDAQYDRALTLDHRIYKHGDNEAVFISIVAIIDVLA